MMSAYGATSGAACPNIMAYLGGENEEYEMILVWGRSISPIISPDHYRGLFPVRFGTSEMSGKFLIKVGTGNMIFLNLSICSARHVRIVVL